MLVIAAYLDISLAAPADSTEVTAVPGIMWCNYCAYYSRSLMYRALPFHHLTGQIMLICVG